MQYTKEALENRLVELDSMQEALAVFQQGWVGGEEIAAMEQVHELYDFDHDDWFSDRSEIESVLDDMEAAGV